MASITLPTNDEAHDRIEREQAVPDQNDRGEREVYEVAQWMDVIIHREQTHGEAIHGEGGGEGGVLACEGEQPGILQRDLPLRHLDMGKRRPWKREGGDDAEGRRAAQENGVVSGEAQEPPQAAEERRATPVDDEVVGGLSGAHRPAPELQLPLVEVLGVAAPDGRAGDHGHWQQPQRHGRAGLANRSDLEDDILDGVARVDEAGARAELERVAEDRHGVEAERNQPSEHEHRADHSGDPREDRPAVQVPVVEERGLPDEHGRRLAEPRVLLVVARLEHREVGRVEERVCVASGDCVSVRLAFPVGEEDLMRGA
mmetsp:Transcript_622/g.1252  ORF Transcript_622/g.1252 Transcript_622/m.1252 type:complete len:314 (+) Transcript_622:297-1238(+)